MSDKYRIRIYEDYNNGGSTGPGGIVAPLMSELSFLAASLQDAEERLCLNVANRDLPRGRVYQICPRPGSPEPARAIAASLDGTFQRVILEPAAGSYSELRRIRSPRRS